MDIAEWLHRLGLARYVGVFRDNAIDLEILPELTEADLEKLGVLLGDRKRMLRVITMLPADVPEATVTAVPFPAVAERRQLTVMFCDLVGSTALSASLDPEDLRVVIAAYHQAVGKTVAGFDGLVAKYMGDGVLVYFGYTRAHEDDAERAVRAGLGVIDAIGRLDVGSAKLQARVGIATGQVVVGDLIGEGPAQEHAVVGETPNLAARLQALARPGTLCSPSESPQQFAGSWGRWTRQISDCGDRLSRRAFARGRHSPSAEGDPGRAGGGNTEFRLTHCWRKTDSNSRSHREGKAMGSHSTQASPSRT